MSTQSACLFTDRLNKAKDLKDAVVYYLKNERQQPGLPRPQQRNVLKKVKSPEWDQKCYNVKRQLSNDLVAFNAKLSNHVNENVTRGQSIIFETVDLNANDGYNWKTGNFTAPLSGIYLFSLSLLSHNYGDGYFVHGEIVHNSQPVARALAVGDPNDNRDQGAVTVFIDVKRGDTIWVRSVDFDKVTVGGDLFSVFCGYLLFPSE